VENAGIIIFALGLGTPLAYFGALLHVLNNAVGKTLLFLTASNVRMAYNSKIMRKVTGAIKVIPVSATFLIVGVFAITGWPPFGAFVSEFTILSAGFAGGYVLPSVLFAGFVAAAFGGFIYYTSRMVFGSPNIPTPGQDAGAPSLFLLGLLLAVLLLLGVYIPAPLVQCIESAASVLKG
jgi:hydrogenase-4 component F